MNQNLFFTPTDILLPERADMHRWSVIACDQFTSDAAYWRAVQDTVGDAPSTLRLMLPEFYLGKCDEAAATRAIQQTMHAYLDSGVFRTVPHSLVLVQRTLPGGAVRCGIVGALDLEAYDYAPDSVTPIRATEGTVASRLPARVRIRAAAALEMPHIMVFYSDPEDTIRREAQAAAGETLYDFDLMSGGGHVRGLRIAGAKADALAARLCVTGVGTDGAHPMRFAIADGNHSLAAARLCWLEKKQTLTPEQAAADPARYALVELVNLHSPAVTFEPIHRVLRRAVIVLETNVPDEKDEYMIELINPVIVETAGEQVGAEGCLSVPDEYGIVARPDYVKVRAQDRHGEWFEVEGHGLTARAFCHELDHLDGVLFIDKATRMLAPEELEQQTKR